MVNYIIGSWTTTAGIKGEGQVNKNCLPINGFSFQISDSRNVKVLTVNKHDR